MFFTSPYKVLKKLFLLVCKKSGDPMWSKTRKNNDIALQVLDIF